VDETNVPAAGAPGAGPGGEPGGHEIIDEARTVRPYTLTGGRTRPLREDLPIESLVSAQTGQEGVRRTPERDRIVELTLGRLLSIAELSAYLHLPLGVIRVLVGDLAEEGSVLIHRPSETVRDPAGNLEVLESVLNGITAL
jgi:hypothetical protein